MNQPIHTITENIVCSSCSKELVGLWVIPNLDQNKEAKQTSLRCNCCYCGDKSFIKNISGDFYLYPAEGLQVVESETLDDDVVLLTLAQE